MKRIIFLTLLIFTFSVFSFGQSQPDYSGTWIFSKIVSQPDEKLQISTFKMNITQTLTDVKITTYVSNILQRGDGRDADGNLIYTFNKENATNIENSNGKAFIKLKAELKNKGKLNLSTLQNIETLNDKFSININENLELINDGKNLKVIREIRNSKSIPIVESFIAQRESVENPLSSVEVKVYDVRDIPFFKGKNSERNLNGIVKYLDKPNPVGNSAGFVPVNLIFDEEGKVIFAQALTGAPMLKSPAVESAMKSKFEPVKIDGKPIKVSGIILYNFSRSGI